MCLQGVNQLTCAKFQTIRALKMRLKLWQAQVAANNCMHFDMLAKHSPVIREKCAAVLSVLIEEFQNRLQDCKQTNKQTTYTHTHTKKKEKTHNIHLCL